MQAAHGRYQCQSQDHAARVPTAGSALLARLPVLSLLGGAITARLFILQIVRHQEFAERAQKQQQRTFEVAPRRGVLYDRNLHELAMTVQADSIYADPSQIADKAAVAGELARPGPHRSRRRADQRKTRSSIA